MTTNVTIPASGESVTSANVAMWHRAHGDVVQAGEVLVTIETDKVSNELEAPGSGVLEIVVPEGEEVPIGTLIARIQESSDEAARPASTAVASAPTPAAPAPAATPQPAPAETESERIQSSQSAAPSIVDIEVPAAGESVTSASVANWRKSDGDLVAAGEVLVLLETDKVSSELEAPAAGRLKILVAEGEEVPIGAVIGQIEPSSEVAAPASAPAAIEKPASPPAEKPQPATKKPETPTPAPTPVAPAPAPQPVANTVSKPDFSLTPVREPSGQSAAVSDGRTTRRKMSMLRRKIATQLVNAQQTAAILTTFNEVDMSGVMKLRKEVQDEFIRKHGVKLGFMSFFVKSVVQALKEVPSINGRIEGNEVVQNHYYDIGVAIGTEKGLFVPVIRDADQKSFAQIETDILDYATKAKEGGITIEDLQGGVFSISNGGTYGSLLSTPILNPPQSGILGMHTIQQRPVAVDGQVVIRPMMYLALSYDHRLVDGKEAVGFLIRIKECLESPARLLLEM